MDSQGTQQARVSRNWKLTVTAAVRVFEHIIVGALMAMIALVILLSTAELGWMILKDISSPPFVLLRINELLDIFGLFLIVLIGIELLGSMKTYFVKQSLHVEVVLQVALISVARRIIVFEIKEPSSLTLVALSVLLVALAVAYYFQTSRRMQLAKAEKAQVPK